MADLSLEFCGVPFKNPVVIASLETTNSPDLMKQAFDYGCLLYTSPSPRD